MWRGKFVNPALFLILLVNLELCQLSSANSESESGEYTNVIESNHRVLSDFELELKYNKFVIALSIVKKVREKLAGVEKSITTLLGDQCHNFWNNLNAAPQVTSDSNCSVTSEQVEGQIIEVEDLLNQNKNYREETTTLVSKISGNLGIRQKYDDIIKSTWSENGGKIENGNPPNLKLYSRNSSVSNAIYNNSETGAKNFSIVEKVLENFTQLNCSGSKSKDNAEEDKDDYYDVHEENNTEDSQVESQTESQVSKSRRDFNLYKNFQNIKNSAFNSSEKLANFTRLIEYVLSAKESKAGNSHSHSHSRSHSYDIVQLAFLVKNSMVTGANSLESKFPPLVQILAWTDKMKINIQLPQSEKNYTSKLSVKKYKHESKLFGDSQWESKDVEIKKDDPERENVRDYWRFEPVSPHSNGILYFAIYNPWNYAILTAENIASENKNETEAGNNNNNTSRRDHHRIILANIRGLNILMAPDSYFWQVSVVNGGEVDALGLKSRFYLTNKRYPHLNLIVDSSGNLNLSPQTSSFKTPALFFVSKSLQRNHSVKNPVIAPISKVQ